MPRKSARTAAVAALPLAVRAIAGFYLAASALGFVAAGYRLVQAFQGSGLHIAIPIGAGMSTWAIGRGLLKRSRRAWWWARLLSALIPPLTVLFVSLALAFPGKATVSFPWGQRAVEPWDPTMILGGLALVLFWGWQFVTLMRSDIRKLFS